MRRDDRLAEFRRLHDRGTFVMPNPHDAGSARLLAALGFPALATTSGGFANTLGRLDGQITRDELVAHVAAVAAATDVPLNVDAEHCFPEADGGVARTVELLAEAGAAGCSIEDRDAGGEIVPLGLAAERLAEAVEAARRHGMLITARTELRLRQPADVDEAIARLQHFEELGAECLFASGAFQPDHVAPIVEAVSAPVNVLTRPGGVTVAELAAIGVRRVSVGSYLTRVGYGALVDAATALRDEGVLAVDRSVLAGDLAAQAFAD